MTTLSEKIQGLTYIPNYLSEAEHDQLVANIDEQPWLTDLKRRVQHYGYRYDYSRRTVEPSLYLGELPEWSQPFTTRFEADKLSSHPLDQLIVNEYEPGQGIAPHVDCVPCFDNVIFSLSLLSSCVMNFSNPAAQLQIPLLLEPRSLLIFKDEARYQWRHGIAGRKTDTFNDQNIVRSRRLSLTFRKVLV